MARTNLALQCPETGTESDFFSRTAQFGTDKAAQRGVEWMIDEIAPSSSLRCSKDKILTPARLEFRIWSTRQTRPPGWRTVREGLERRDDLMFPASDRRDRSG
jgi:hypothetical protein